MQIEFITPRSNMCDSGRRSESSSVGTLSPQTTIGGIGFAPEWTKDLPNRNFELRPVRGVDLKIGLGVAWNKEDPTVSRDDIIDIARSLARPAR
ncbi:hypothetical protein BHMPCIPO_04899 [Ensifer sesbaniae]|nr:hypothetical protein [Ensifer sesbaniae]